MKQFVFQCAFQCEEKKYSGVKKVFQCHSFLIRDTYKLVIKENGGSRLKIYLNIKKLDNVYKWYICNPRTNDIVYLSKLSNSKNNIYYLKNVYSGFECNVVAIALIAFLRCYKLQEFNV